MLSAMTLGYTTACQWPALAKQPLGAHPSKVYTHSWCVGRLLMPECIAFHHVFVRPVLHVKLCSSVGSAGFWPCNMTKEAQDAK